ncbi:MAG: hypothetical protein HZC28_09715 [Spirochaetes bacterium]|nr:hypothetical protein [Spirochaetota bacterium]
MRFVLTALICIPFLLSGIDGSSTFSERYNRNALLLSNNNFITIDGSNRYELGIFGPSRELRTAISNSPQAQKTFTVYDDYRAWGNGLFWGGGWGTYFGGFALGIGIMFAFPNNIGITTGIGVTIGGCATGLTLVFVGLANYLQADSIFFNTIWEYNYERTSAPDIYRKFTFIEQHQLFSAEFQRADKSRHFAFTGYGTDTAFLNMLRVSADAGKVLQDYERDVLFAQIFVYTGLAISAANLYWFVYNPRLTSSFIPPENRFYAFLAICVVGGIVESFGSTFSLASIQKLRTAVWYYNRDICDGKADLKLCDSETNTSASPISLTIGPGAFVMRF